MEQGGFLFSRQTPRPVFPEFHSREIVTQSDLSKASEKVKAESEKIQNASVHTQSTLKGLIQKKLDIVIVTNLFCPRCDKITLQIITKGMTEPFSHQPA